ncbi:MAG: HD domain-containing protein [Candidatus Wildermuthbacteria bacterium]|nr:HD domain-containing protein [Candidatus Wildermuthbacteria bacterium]
MKIPKEVQSVVLELEKKGFEAYVVGGCVRDILLGRVPEDWDIATNATPEEIQSVFSKTFYENKFFTVTVLTGSQDASVKEIEVTTFRSDSRYTDRRRPEEVRYAETIEEDLSRRDFTVNAIALKLAKKKEEFIDPFEGKKDLKAEVIRAVGKPEERFAEDALRMMRAIRFSSTLGFDIGKETREAILANSMYIKDISQERIRDEFEKIILSDRAYEGIEALRELNMLKYIVPELQEGYGVTQNKHHIYTVWEHNLYSLQYAVKQKWSLEVRLASLFHDIAKPRVKRGEGQDATFHGHEVMGEKMAEKILSRMKFKNSVIEKVSLLVRYHMFYYNVDEVTASSVRRLLANVGLENIEDLLQVRMADRMGSGVAKAEPYKLRHLRYIIDKVSKDPISPKMLKMNGNDLIKLLGIEPGPRVGWILSILLQEVLEDPSKNTQEILEARAKELAQLSQEELEKMAKAAKKEKEKVENREDEMTKQKYWVN